MGRSGARPAAGAPGSENLRLSSPAFLLPTKIGAASPSLQIQKKSFVPGEYFTGEK